MYSDARDMLDVARTAMDCICNLRADASDPFRVAERAAERRANSPPRPPRRVTDARSGRRRDPRSDFRPGSPQPPRERVVHARAKDELIAIGALIDDFPRSMDLGQELSVAGREADLGERAARPNRHAQRASQRLQSAVLQRGWTNSRELFDR